MNRTAIPVSPRTEGMVEAGPEYVQASDVWAAIMNSKGLEYDRIQSMEDDLALQLSPYTATWGLVYWEQSVGLPQRPTEAYDYRRPQVLTRLQNSKNFDLEMIRTIIDNYGEPATVTVDPANFVVAIVFHRGIPPYFAAIKRDIESVMHAHLGTAYTYKYIAGGAAVKLGTRHTIGAYLTVKPYTLDDYSTSAVLKTAAFAMVSASITIQKQGV